MPRPPGGKPTVLVKTSPSQTTGAMSTNCSVALVSAGSTADDPSRRRARTRRSRSRRRPAGCPRRARSALRSARGSGAPSAASWCALERVDVALEVLDVNRLVVCDRSRRERARVGRLGRQGVSPPGFEPRHVSRIDGRPSRRAVPARSPLGSSQVPSASRSPQPRKARQQDSDREPPRGSNRAEPLIDSAS